VTDLEIAAYLDRGLSIVERDRMEDHLGECPECRRHVLDADELVRRVRRPRRLIIGGAVVAAAAALILVAMPSLRRSDGALENPLYRDAAASSTLIAYGPAGESRVGSLRFIWSPARGAMSYRLTVSRADGATVWTQSGRDTVATLPASITLRVGDRYFWVSDALLADGGSRSTGLREFTPIR
jgi:hypothetical protein